MRSFLATLLISALALAEAGNLRESPCNLEPNDIDPITWPIDILELEVNYELMYEVEARLKRIGNKDSRNRIKNFVVKELRQCTGKSHNDETNCVKRATYLYRQFAWNNLFI